MQQSKFLNFSWGAFVVFSFVEDLVGSLSYSYAISGLLLLLNIMISIHQFVSHTVGGRGHVSMGKGTTKKYRSYMSHGAV